jgi:DNA-binding IclR family transcriptional regulator
MQVLNDTSADVYEAIATLEHSGRRVSRADLAGSTGLPDAELAQSLAMLTGEGLVKEIDDGRGVVYVPSHRGWSAAPDRSAGQKPS